MALWIAGALAVAALLVWRLRTPSLQRQVARAARDENASALIEAILAMRPAAQADAFNHAIRALWDSYQRPLAAQVVRTLAENHSQVPIAQYWLAQVQAVEPQLAREVFDATFLETYFQPHVAATCGPVG